MLTTIDQIKDRVLPAGGFAEESGAGLRPDATSWAILALDSKKSFETIVLQARNALAAIQHKDGRISISLDHPEAHWPTALSVLAWGNSSKHRAAQSAAVQFLLNTSGFHWEKKSNDPAGHDPSIKGWPWVAGTHSWVEPTALALLALRTAHQDDDPRVTEGTKMLLDRQLPDGGWNYGNTTVFGTELFPMPDSTGFALKALAGSVPKSRIIRSLDYLKIRVQNIKTPFSLSLALLGLSSWGNAPKNKEELIEQCLKRQSKYGQYTTSNLALLTLASSDAHGPQFF